VSQVTPFLFDAANWSAWRDWIDSQKSVIGEHLSRIVLIFVLLVVVDLIFRRVLGRVLFGAIGRAARARTEDPAAIRRRADTLVSTLNWVLSIFLFFLGAGLVLGEIGLNVSALIAGVGVVGIALGLGAQTLVKDVINGMFILIEDQYAVGDMVTVGGSSGEVIEINPRRTVLRDEDGNVYTIPNSAVTVAINRTGSLNRLRVEIDVPFGEADHATELANLVGGEVAQSLSAEVLSAPKVVSQRVVGEGDVRLVIVGDARPAARWQVESEYRRRLKRKFDAERVEMRFEGGEAGKE
jgi:small-conductance mechanosensitive channel